jgi:long-chain acyl-CoA synthetase
MRIIDLLKHSVAKFPDRTAIKDDTTELTYSQLDFSVSYLSDYLTLKGFGPGIKAALLLGNSALYFISFFAVSAAGGTVVPMSSKMTVYEAVKFIKRSGVSIAITERALAKKLANKLNQTDLISIFTIDWGCSNHLEIQPLFLAEPKEDIENRDVALMVYTSGTTGYSKIVMLTNEQLISNMFVYRAVMGFDEHNIVYCSLPLHHIYCICAQVLTHISLGDTFIATTRPFFIKDFLKAVQKHRVTITAFVPYMAILMSEYPNPDEYNTSSLKYITLSGAKTPNLVYRKLTKAFSHIKFINTYGMSEAGSRISISAPFPTHFPIDSVGRPIPGIKVKIVDEMGKTVAANSPGEIFVKSSGIMKGYYQQPDLTAKTKVDGWLKTGDIGKLDENGNLFILGRIKDIIITGGENLCPAEIEERLIEHYAIREAAVVGQKHKLLQEVPFAFIVKNNASEKLTPIDIIEYCKNKLSSHKIPRSIKFLEKLPKLNTNKVDRNELKKIADNLY